MFKIYKGDDVIVEGESPLTITGLEPNTNITTGEYQVVRVKDDKESEKVDIPAFTTLPIAVTGVTLSPKTSNAQRGESGNRQLSAIVEPSNATNKSVSYSISPSIEGLSVSNGGNITWDDTVPAGEYTTTVTTADGGYIDTHVLTLEPVVTTDTETETTDIVEYETERIDTDELPLGEERTIQEGVDGYTTVTYTVTYEDGEEVSREETDREVTPPVDEIIEVGTYEEEEEPENPDPPDDEEGD